MKLTRRQLAAAAVGQAIRLPARAAPQFADEELTAARERLKANADGLAATNLPMAAEPAFQFKA
jgi:hypothetical protein